MVAPLIGGIVAAAATGGVSRLVDVAIDLFIAGLDRGIIGNTVREGEKRGDSEDKITDDLIQKAKAEGIKSRKILEGIPDLDPEA